MKTRVRFKPRAIDDVAEISAYYRLEGGSELGERFEQAIAETIDRIAFAPMSGAVYAGQEAELFAIRWMRVMGFAQHLAFYQIASDRIEVLRVVHGARHIDALLD